MSLAEQLNLDAAHTYGEVENQLVIRNHKHDNNLLKEDDSRQIVCYSSRVNALFFLLFFFLLIKGTSSPKL